MLSDAIIRLSAGTQSYQVKDGFKVLLISFLIQATTREIP